MVGGGSIILALAAAAILLTMTKIITNPSERNIVETKGKNALKVKWYL